MPLKPTTDRYVDIITNNHHHHYHHLHHQHDHHQHYHHQHHHYHHNNTINNSNNNIITNRHHYHHHDNNIAMIMMMIMMVMMTTTMMMIIMALKSAIRLFSAVKFHRVKQLSYEGGWGGGNLEFQENTLPSPSKSFSKCHIRQHKKSSPNRDCLTVSGCPSLPPYPPWCS